MTLFHSRRDLKSCRIENNLCFVGGLEKHYKQAGESILKDLTFKGMTRFHSRGAKRLQNRENHLCYWRLRGASSWTWIPEPITLQPLPHLALKKALLKHSGGSGFEGTRHLPPYMTL